jgi:hypothetical protein
MTEWKENMKISGKKDWVIIGLFQLAGSLVFLVTGIVDETYRTGKFILFLLLFASSIRSLRMYTKIDKIL